jgi:hypothetical protein
MACGNNSNQMWGTPVAQDDQKSPEAYQANRIRRSGEDKEHPITSLTVQVKLWPTPTAHDPKDMGSPPTAKQRHSPGLPVIAEAHGHQLEMETGTSTSARVDLNPHFVEQLMGLPKGWLTPCTLVETDWFQQWLQQHSLNYSTDTNTDA